MYVLEGSGSDPWAANFTFKSQLDTYDQFAIDGTYFQHSTGLYHIYSCWYRKYDAWPSNLCITKSKIMIRMHVRRRHANELSVEPIYCRIEHHRASHPLRSLEPLGANSIRQTQHIQQPPTFLQRGSRTIDKPQNRSKLCRLLSCKK